MSQLRILIVDDEPNLLESFKIGLELKDYTVSLAANGREALAACEDRSFDVVLLDIRMPEMDGLETLKRLKQNRPDQAVIMLTDHVSLESAVEAGRLGAFDYVEKPSTPEAVDLRIRKAIENISLSEENKLLKTQLREKYHFEGLVGNSPLCRTFTN